MLNSEKTQELTRIKKFLLKLFFFLAVFLVISSFLNTFYVDLILSNSLRFRMESQFQGAKKDARILGIGDSHIKYGIHTNYLEKSFITATTGENYIQTYFKLKTHLENSDLDVALLIMPIDLHSFSSYRTDRLGNLAYWEKYLNYIELGIYKHDLPRYLSFWLQGEFAYFGGVSETIEFMKLRSEDQPAAELVNGYISKVGNFEEYDRKEDLADLRVDFHLRGSDVLDPDLLAYFFRILELARDNNIQVVLVRFPVTAEYYSSAKVIPSIDRHYENLDSILALNGYSFIPIFNYHDIFWGRYDLFSDPDHLNERGAIVFTKMLKEDLEALDLIP